MYGKLYQQRFYAQIFGQKDIYSKFSLKKLIIIKFNVSFQFFQGKHFEIAVARFG
jgi:hypothetical protein